MTYSDVLSPYRRAEPEPESLTPNEQTARYVAVMRERAAVKRSHARVLRGLLSDHKADTAEFQALVFAFIECDRQASINEWMADFPDRSSKECHL